MATTPIPLVVASHNLMHGRRLEALLPHYLALRDRERLDLLCLQEDRFPERVEDGSPPSARIAAALGPSYRAVRHPESAALAIVYDGRVIACGDRTVIPLPRLSGLSWFERLYVAEGCTKLKLALLA